MNPKLVIFLCLAIFISILSPSTSESQILKTSSKWKSPFLTIEIAGSYNLPIQESKGDLGDFFRFKNYGTSLGWGAQFNFKFGLGPKGTYRPYIFLGYSQLHGSNDDSAYIGSNYINNGYPLKGSQVYGTPPNSSTKGKYAFTEVDRKKRAFIPFIGTEFFISIITGKYKQTPVSAPYSPGVETPYIIKTDVRFGIGAGAGMDMRFTQAFGMVVGFKYKLSNLIGKTSDYLLEENKMNLLDKGDTSINTNLKENRNIGFFEFYLGATFFIGKTQK